MIVRSPAKINLFLYIKGRDSRGYHILQSLFYKIHDLYDEMEFELRDDAQIIVSPEIKDNIIIDAAKTILPKNMGITIKVKKNIPIGAGLGGGSSNAATTLMTINGLLELGYTTEQLIAIGKTIGSDVEFFIRNRDAIYFDGDNAYQIELKNKLNILLVKPDFSISTKDVYDIHRRDMPDDMLLPREIDLDNIEEHIFHGGNDLYRSALELRPQLSDVIQLLQSQDGLISARMSGSGSAFFGLFKSKEAKESCLNKLLISFPQNKYY